MNLCGQSLATSVHRPFSRRVGSPSLLPGAFTLIEVIVSIAIFSMLAVVVTVTMFGTVQSQYLEEGSQQFETVLRMARAESANQGRRMRVAWSAGEDRILLLWEPQPLAQPGQFVEYTSSSWADLIPDEMITIVSSLREGADEADALTFGSKSAPSTGTEAEQQTIIDFYPDGSSDSATIELASREIGDLRRAIIEMDGLNYFITTRIMGATELAQWRAENGKTMEVSRDY